jgi:hypothetical protein
MPVEPTPEQLAEIQAIAEGPDDGPLVMLNLNRYGIGRRTHAMARSSSAFWNASAAASSGTPRSRER